MLIRDLHSFHCVIYVCIHSQASIFISCSLHDSLILSDSMVCFYHMASLKWLIVKTCFTVTSLCGYDLWFKLETDNDGECSCSVHFISILIQAGWQIVHRVLVSVYVCMRLLSSILVRICWVLLEMLWKLRYFDLRSLFQRAFGWLKLV